jgi:branched-chain amino acid transport system ATP-binding protein
LQVFGKMSVRDNLIVAAQEHRGSMASRLFAPSDSDLGDKADALLAQFRLTHVAHQKAGELSYGQQKLADIAMAFMSEPALVLLDEPCAGVNPALVGGISRLLKQLNQERQGSFVVIEHNMEFVMGLCHRIMVMVEGQVLAIGTPDEIRANKQARCNRARRKRLLRKSRAATSNRRRSCPGALSSRHRRKTPCRLRP